MLLLLLLLLLLLPETLSVTNHAQGCSPVGATASGMPAVAGFGAISVALGAALTGVIASRLVYGLNTLRWATTAMPGERMAAG